MLWLGWDRLGTGGSDWLGWVMTCGGSALVRLNLFGFVGFQMGRCLVMWLTRLLWPVCGLGELSGYWNLETCHHGAYLIALYEM